tara:strand:+ start:82 stop:357 length:276 start_codon:yes stop_codon:yes gene_type:complete
MTKERKFLPVVERIVKLLSLHQQSVEKTVLDVKLMVWLDFSPQSWYVWKKQIIQWFEQSTGSLYEERLWKINYDKKSRMWWAEPIEDSDKD